MLQLMCNTFGTQKVKIYINVPFTALLLFMTMTGCCDHVTFILMLLVMTFINELIVGVYYCNENMYVLQF